MIHQKSSPTRRPAAPTRNGHGHGNGHVSARPGNGQLQAILDTAIEGIIVIDERGLIQTFNRAAARMFGYKPSEVIGQNISLLMPRPFHGEHDRYLSNYLQTGRPKIIGIGREVPGLRKDGTTFPIELAVSEVRHNGRRGFTGIFRDISNRKRLEKAILDVSEREQRRIGRDLHDGLCQELAGTAFLVKTMHHQLQTGQPVSQQAADDVAVLLQNAVKHARALARGLQPVDHLPGGLSAALAHLAADNADLHNIRCHFRCPRPVEIADPAAATHLYRIAQECVRDAIHHAHAKTVTISLSRRNGHIELSVSDDAKRPSKSEIFSGTMVSEMIHHRARMISARITIRRRPRAGVSVTCHIPAIKAG
jgi:PAS domain S-box-containing protein